MDQPSFSFYSTMSKMFNWLSLSSSSTNEDVEPQASSSEQITKEIKTVAPEGLPDDFEDERSHVKSDAESSVNQGPPEEEKVMSPTAQEGTVEPQRPLPEPKPKEVPPVVPKRLPDDFEGERSLLKSDTEPPVDHCHTDEENVKSPTIREGTVEPNVSLSEPKPKEVPPVVPKRLPDKVKAQSSLLTSSTEPLPVYEVPLEEEQMNIPGCRRFRFGNDELQKRNRTIMVMGATGAGKSTLIDGMINYILGVHREDEYRFKLVREVQKDSQADSQTSEVTVYKLNYQDGFQIDYSLTIIDTPGFGDTRGIDRDMEITEMIRNLFTSKTAQVFELDAVCFVVQAAFVRLTTSQKYVFDSVLSIFGKDIAENIRVLVTFADGKRPPVLEAIIKSGVPCPEEKGAPLHFKFNNSALFTCNTSSTNEEEDDEDFDEMFWKMGQKSMKRFFAALNQIQTKSLILTKVVLSERKQLENLVENLRKQVRVGLSKMEEIKQTSEILQTHQAEISRNEKFEYEVTITEPHQILKKENTFITNCQQCSYTCHDSCAFANDADKMKCCAMTNGYCTVCPGKCIWSVHFNQKYRWDYREVTKKETLQELKEKYDIATGEKNAVEVLMEKLEDEYEDVQIEVAGMMDMSSASLNRLKEIALKPDPLSTPDYIDILIKGEKSEAKPGWQPRVDSLMDMKEKAEYMAKVGRGEILLKGGRRSKREKKSFLQKMMERGKATVVQLVERVVS